MLGYINKVHKSDKNIKYQWAAAVAILFKENEKYPVTGVGTHMPLMRVFNNLLRTHRRLTHNNIYLLTFEA